MNSKLILSRFHGHQVKSNNLNSCVCINALNIWFHERPLYYLRILNQSCSAWVQLFFQKIGVPPGKTTNIGIDNNGRYNDHARSLDRLIRARNYHYVLSSICLSFMAFLQIVQLMCATLEEVIVVEEEKTDSFDFYFNSVFNNTR